MFGNNEGAGDFEGFDFSSEKTQAAELSYTKGIDTSTDITKSLTDLTDLLRIHPNLVFNCSKILCCEITKLAFHH